MESFDILTVGSNFSKEKHGAQIKKYNAKKAESNATPQQAAVPAVVPVANPVAAPLNFFGKKKTDEGAIEEQKEEPKKTEHKPLATMTRAKMTNIWKKHKLAVTGTDPVSPIQHFSDLVRPPLNVPEYVVNNLFRREHKVPTPIQMQAIPALISRQDVLACAPTGSGKTIAFLVPMFALLKAPDATCGVRGLVISPTMELAMQIEREVFFLMKGQRWKLVQHGQTTKNKDIMVSTPGRVVKMLKQSLISLANVQYLVFDEGDKLWDKSSAFLDEVDKIISACERTDKVVSVFSATLSEQVESMARSTMNNTVTRMIVNSRKSASVNVDQKLLFVSNELGKIVAMKNLMREGVKPPVLVFVQSIERSKELYEEINRAGMHVAMMNSKMSTEERDDIVLKFRLGEVWFLITTELLARGIDFKNVGTVINFDFPITSASYIHRVGRTGRANKRGNAITFFTEGDKERLPAVAKIARESGSEVPDWMLTIEVDKKRKRELAKTTPKRMVVNTKKRMMIGEQRIHRQLNAAEREGKNKKGRHDDSDSEEIGAPSDDDYDSDEE